MLTPTLTVSLPAIVANWEWLSSRFTGEECAAVVKANAYGLGMIPVATALEAAGCGIFFVATLEEAILLRETLPDVRIVVFHGVQANEEDAFVEYRLIPTLNSEEQIARWKPIAIDDEHAVSVLHVDTAMGRLGLQPEAFHALIEEESSILEACRVGLLMSHLACAGEPDHPLNAAQLALMKNASALAPHLPVSLCNSGGVLLPAEYHFDLARPGCSLYGIAPHSAVANPMQHVATWHAPILMTRTLTKEQTIGYGATYTAPAGTRIATVASGYADGYPRYLSNKGMGYIGDYPTKLVGRVTMDMLMFDVTHIPESVAHEGAAVTLLGDKDGIRVDEVAAAASTIGYEILTSIGDRVRRIYL